VEKRRRAELALGGWRLREAPTGSESWGETGFESLCGLSGNLAEKASRASQNAVDAGGLRLREPLGMRSILGVAGFYSLPKAAITGPTKASAAR
jgi:hypothetical protein